MMSTPTRRNSEIAPNPRSTFNCSIWAGLGV